MKCLLVPLFASVALIPALPLPATGQSDALHIQLIAPDGTVLDEIEPPRETHLPQACRATFTGARALGPNHASG